MASEISVKAPDLVCAGLLIGEDHLTQFFELESFGKGGRPDYVTEHHSELPPLGRKVRRRESLGVRGWGLKRCCWTGERLRWGGEQRRLGTTGCCRRYTSSPDQHGTFFVSGQVFGPDEFVLEVLQVVVIKTEPSLHCWVRDPPL